MTRKTRTVIFLFLLILFLLAAPLIVLYSLGWRFDWTTKKIVQTGVFYFKIWPKSTQIYLDGNLREKTDFFFGSVLIEDLYPKKYEVEVKKQGFHSWKKTLEIKGREVTESKNIVLIPENPNFTAISKGTQNFFFSPDNKKIILKETSNINPSWSLKLFEIEKNLKSHLINERDISKEEVQLIDLKFSSDSKRILLKVGLKERLGYYIFEIDKIPAVLTPLDFLNSDVEGVYFNPQNPQKLLVEKVEALSEADLADKKVSSPVLENIITFSIFNNNIYYLDSSGFLFKNNLSFDQGERLNIIPFSLNPVRDSGVKKETQSEQISNGVKKETEYKIAVSNSHIALQENDTLYIFDENKKSLQKIFEPIKNFKFSLSSKKLVYFNNYEIWVLFLEKKYDQPQKEAKDQLFITRFSEKIDDVFWYTDHYLIFNVRNKIKIAEIDDRDRINIVDFTEFKEPKIFWNQDNKKLYVLSEEALFTSEKLVP